MNCFPCFRSQRSMNSHESKDQGNSGGETKAPDANIQKATNKSMMEEVNQAEILAQTFNFRELATATRNFRQECLLGEGGFGRVYKGTLASSGQVVAVKQLDRHGLPGNKEFLAEILKLSLIHHENLVKLIGYCADGDQRLLVYEFMPGGSVQDHLLDISTEQKPLDWFTRMKIAFGACKGLEYLHNKANPPVIYCDLKPSNILLDKEFNPKLSDFGLTKLSPSGDKLHIAPRAMGTYGYCAPEYQRLGQMTMESDVYSFGVVLLELISGRRAVDTNKPIDEQNLVAWAQPFFRDPKKFPDLADPRLDKRFPEKDLNQAVAIAAMCLQEEPAARPLMSDVATTLSFLSVAKEILTPTPQPPAIPPVEELVVDHNQLEHKAGDSSDSQEDTDSDNGEDEDEASDREDAQIENHQIQVGNMSHHRYDEHSDTEDGDSVDGKGKDAEEGYQYTTSDSNSWVNSRLLSMGEGIIANREISTISRDKSVSLESNGNCGSYDGSVSSSDNSSRGSRNNNELLSQRSSKISRHSVSNKIRRVSEEGSDSSSRRSSMKSQNLTASMSQGSSIDTRDGIRSLSHKSSRRSWTKSMKHDDNSCNGSENGSLSSVHSSSRGSKHGSIHLDHTNSRVSEN